MAQIERLAFLFIIFPSRISGFPHETLRLGGEQPGTPEPSSCPGQLLTWPISKSAWLCQDKGPPTRGPWPTVAMSEKKNGKTNYLHNLCDNYVWPKWENWQMMAKKLQTTMFIEHHFWPWIPQNMQNLGLLTVCRWPKERPWRMEPGREANRAWRFHQNDSVWCLNHGLMEKTIGNRCKIKQKMTRCINKMSAICSCWNMCFVGSLLQGPRRGWKCPGASLHRFWP